METLRELLGNDLTNIYKLDSNSSKKYISSYSQYQWNREDKEYYFSPMLSYGDYDNSCAVERSNYRVFYEQFKDSEFCNFVSGDYGHSSVAISLDCNDFEILEILAVLADYPSINDDDVLLLTMEMEYEYIENFIKWDLADILKSKYENYFYHEILDKDKFISLWHELKDSNNAYFEVESGGNGYIDKEKLFEGADFTDIIKIELYYCNESGEWITEFA